MPTSLSGTLSCDKLALLTQALRTGRTIIYPTETFFGIACDPMNSNAVSLVYQAKRRSATKPLPLLAADREMIGQCCDLSGVPEVLLSFWPGPLTILLKAKKPFAAPLLDKEGRAAIRVSSHPAAIALSRSLGCPITATSANISGREAVSCAEELDKELTAAIDIVADVAPAPKGGMPSTIVSLAEDGRIILHREGAISKETLLQAGLELAD